MGRLKRTVLDDILSIWFKLSHDQSKYRNSLTGTAIKEFFQQSSLEKETKNTQTDIPIHPARDPILPEKNQNHFVPYVLSTLD